MKTYIITYDLRNPEMDYMPLYTAIKTLDSKWQHITEDAWLIKTDKTAGEIQQAISEGFYRQPRPDRYFICEIQPENVNGFLGTSVWKWLKEETESEDDEKSIPENT